MCRMESDPRIKSAGGDCGRANSSDSIRRRAVLRQHGAGDLFASGFLLGMARGQTLESALKTGCLAASEVISHIGARPLLDLQDLTAEHGLVG